MDSKLEKMLREIIGLLEEIKDNTAEIYWVKSAVEDVETAVKGIKK